MSKFDALKFAEQMTGKSYKDDENTALLGLALQMEHSAKVKKQMQEDNDSHYGITVLEFLTIAKLEGFEIIHTKVFESCYDRYESFYSLWNPEGILLTVESYGEVINTAKMYYNLNVSNCESLKFKSTGSYVHSDLQVWCGDHDVREGFRKSLKDIRTATVMPVWIKQPFLWLLTYMDTREPYDCDQLNDAMIARYPTKVQSAIAGVM